MALDMSISKRDLGLLLGLAGLVITVVAYKGVFENFNNKTDDLQAQIQTQTQVETDLQMLEQNMPFYQSEIERMTAENTELEKRFPADILPEDQIMYAVNMEDNNDIFFTDLSYGTSEVIFGGETQQAAGTSTESTDEDEDTTETEATDETAAAEASADQSATNTGIQAYKLIMTMSYEATYQGLKDTITYNNAQQDRMVIDGLTATYDDTTGQLTGSMTLNQYYLTGTENEYVSPYVPNMKTGTSNIFGTNDGAAVGEAE